MIVADTSALVSLATADTLSLVLEEFDVNTTETVVGELTETGSYEDRHADAARLVLEHRSRLTVHDVPDPGIETSRVDVDEATCTALVRELEAAFLVTDDYRALPELQSLIESQVVISPFVLSALVERDVLDPDEARSRVETLAEERDWLGAPIYRRTLALFDE